MIVRDDLDMLLEVGVSASFGKCFSNGHSLEVMEPIGLLLDTGYTLILSSKELCHPKTRSMCHNRDYVEHGYAAYLGGSPIARKRGVKMDCMLRFTRSSGTFGKYARQCTSDVRAR